MRSLRNLFALSLLLFTSIGRAEESDLLERLKRSLSAGTGGQKARFLLCNFDAVLFFADGHQTPELISDGRAWKDILMTQMRPDLQADAGPLPKELSASSRAAIERSTKRFRTYVEEFDRESRHYARLVVGATDEDAERYRRATRALSNKATRELPKLAEESLSAIRAELPDKQRRLFFDWLQKSKNVLVIGIVDFEKVRVYQLDEC